MEKRESRRSVGRKSIADEGGHEQRRNNFSKRFADGTCSIIKKNCKFCGHHKALSKPRGVFCSRCRRRLNK